LNLPLFFNVTLGTIKNKGLWGIKEIIAYVDF